MYKLVTMFTKTQGHRFLHTTAVRAPSIEGLQLLVCEFNGHGLCKLMNMHYSILYITAMSESYSSVFYFSFLTACVQNLFYTTVYCHGK